MRLGKVDFPDPVVAAARNHELVVFAGAGVSMGKPAGLPGFRALTEKIAEQSDESELDIKKALNSISPDKYLGRLKGRGMEVHALAAEELSKPGIRHTELHRVLLSLYPGPEAVRVVTTNYDLLFEQAARDAFPALTMPAVYSSELPTRKDFRGIVHLHGDAAHPSDMVLTKNNFAKAYLSEDPWAQRFVINLLSTNTLLFVGYSGDDVIFDYLVSGLLSAESPRHFAMVRAEDEQKWLERGIQPVLYPASRSDPDGALCAGLSSLAEHAGASVAEQRSRIEKLASKVPSELNREEIDLVLDALSDTVHRKFFTRVADSPEWVFWLDERKHLGADGETYLNALFGDGALSESDRELAEWLAEKFVRDGAEELFALTGKHGIIRLHLTGKYEIKLHEDFWGRLLWRAGMPKKQPINGSCLARWVSLLLATAPPLNVRGSALGLFRLGERCIENELTDCVVEIFGMLIAPRLIPELPPRPRTDGKLDSGIDAELSPIAGPYELNELWQKGLQPKLPQIAEQLLATLAENLAKQHWTLCVWGKASPHRSAIESHPQNGHPQAADVVINAARDCLQWLAEHERNIALHWCRQLVKKKAPILRRLAVYTLTELADAPGFGPDEKIDWLLSCGTINDNDMHHEIFRIMKLTYPRASQSSRQAVIDAVRKKDKGPDGNKTTEAHFNWLHWLHLSYPGCSLTEKARDQVLDEHPEFRPRKHPDFEMWIEVTSGFVESHSSWPSDQLVAEPAKNWVSKLLEDFSEESWGDRDKYKQVATAAKKDFGWGGDLADALVEKGEWKSNLWEALLQAWAEADADEILRRHVLQHLSQGELHSEHFAAIADLLYAWARSGKHAGLLADADCIAVKLWPVLPRDTQDIWITDGVPDWMTTAINRPSGVLARFWIERCYLDGLRDERRAALSAIVRDLGPPGRLGRTVLAHNLPMLLQKEEAWTQENLLPFFEWREDRNLEDCQAVWDGFLHRPHLNVWMLSLMEEAFHAAVEKLQDERCFRITWLRKQFHSICAEIVTNRRCVPEPLKKWLPHVLRNCSRQDKSIFVTEIGVNLERMSAEDRTESWHCWIKEYWRLRKHGAIAGRLLKEETTGMFHWLPFLEGSAFEEAVTLATQTTPMPDLQCGFLFRELNESGLCETHPEAMAKFVLHLGEAESAEYVWVDGGELIEKLLALKLPSVLKGKLKDLAESPKFGLQRKNAA